MKYSPESYALALSGSLEKSKDKELIISNFLKLVKKNGDQKLLPKIFDRFKKIEIRKKGGSHIRIEFAREPSESELESITEKFKSRDWIETHLNPLLVAGVRITLNGEKELDNSLARKLHKLFNNKL